MQQPAQAGGACLIGMVEAGAEQQSIKSRTKANGRWLISRSARTLNEGGSSSFARAGGRPSTLESSSTTE